MDLFLASYLHPQIASFLGERVAYVGDAAGTMPDAPFTVAEREAVADACREVVELPLAKSPLEMVRGVLADVDSVYVASGATFDLDLIA